MKLFWTQLLGHVFCVAMLTDIAVSQTGLCQQVSIEYCKNIGFNFTTFPNFANSFNVMDARMDMNMKYASMIKSGCSEYAAKLICAIYTPVCDERYVKIIGPCMPLCTQVQRRCQHVLEAMGGKWAGAVMCTQYVDRNSRDNPCLDIPQDVRVYSRNQTKAEKDLRRCLRRRNCSMEVSEGSQINELYCNANCYPDCTYHWYRDRRLVAVGQTLPMGPFDSKRMNGTYVCTASTIMGSAGKYFTLIGGNAAALQSNVEVLLVTVCLLLFKFRVE